MRVIMAFILMAVLLQAKGVKAGTVITNQATLDFMVGDNSSFTIKSNEVKNIVSQVLSFILKWQDTKPTEIYEGANQKVLNLSLVNEGNGQDDIALSYSEDIALSSLVESMQFFVDSNKNGIFDRYDQNIKEVKLEADEKVDLFLVTSLKDKAFSLKDKLSVDVKAKSKLGGSGIKGTLHEGAGVDGVDAIDGIYGGVYQESVFYSLKSQNPTFLKKVDYFEDKKYYLVTLSLNIAGNAVLKDLLLKDDMPKGLYYRKNSIKVDGKYQSDKVDSDLASFDFRVNRLTVKMPEVSLSKNITVTYILDKEVR